MERNLGKYDAFNNVPILKNNDPQYQNGDFYIVDKQGDNTPSKEYLYLNYKYFYENGTWISNGLNTTTDILDVSFTFDNPAPTGQVLPDDDLTTALKKLQDQVNTKNNIRPIVSITRNYYQITVDQFKTQTTFLVSAPNLIILMPDPTLITPNGYEITIKNLNITNTQIIAVTGLMDNENNYSLISPYISRNFLIYNGNFLLT